MLDLLFSLSLLFGLAWLARALMGARELTWPRLLIAAIGGLAAGDFIALVTVADLEDLPNLDYSQFQAISWPFRLIATMAAIVVLELISSSTRPRGKRRRPIRAMRGLLSTVGRGLQVVAIAVKRGLGPLIGLRRGEVSTRSPEELARRVRLAMEDAGGMFVKLGQLLATRPDLLPPAAQAELGRLHAAAAPLPRNEIESVIAEELGPVDSVFEEFDWEALGSASIAQVHAARLAGAGEVVVKVRRPGLERLVERDLRIVMWLARVARRRTTWGAQYEVDLLASEFADALRSELDFTIEAQNATEHDAWLDRHPLVDGPSVVDRLTTPRVLVMERLEGTPLSNLDGRLDQDTARRLADALCVSQVTAMLQGERFHGDPHPGNVLILDDDGLGLIDFGIAGRLDAFERSAVFQILVALRLEQPTVLYEAMISIGAVGAQHDPDRIERSFAQFMASYLGSTLPPPEALTDLLRLTTELQLRLPASTTTMFRALATLAGTLEQLSPGYPLIEVVADIGGDEFRQRIAPDSLQEFVHQEWARLAPLISRAPRHFDRLASLAESGRLTTRLRLFSHPDDVRVVERFTNRLLLTLLSVGTGAVSVMMLGTEGGPIIEAADVPLLEILGWIGLTLAVMLLLRVLLAVLRSGD